MTSAENKPLGLIIGSTTPYTFQFVGLKTETGHPVTIRRGQFVKIPASEEKDAFLLGRVISVVRQNELLSASLPAQVALMAGTGKATLDDLGFRRDITESLIGVVEVLGSRSIDGKAFLRPRMPVYPGERVYEADTEFLLKQLSKEGEDNLCLGSLRDDPEVPVFLDLTELVSKHFAILAMTGAGKSYAGGVMIEEVFSISDLPIVIFDPHGEYYSLARSIGFEKNFDTMRKLGMPEELVIRARVGVEKVQKNVVFYSTDPVKSEIILQKVKKKYPDIIVKVNPLKIQLADLDPSQLNLLLSSFYSITEAQMRIIDAIWSDIHAKAERGEFIQFSTIENEIERVGPDFVRGTAPIDLLIAKLSLLNTRSFFAKTIGDKRISSKDLIRKGQVTVIDLSLTPLLEQQAVAAIVGKKILAGRIADEIPPVLLLFEEAHRFAPGGAETSVSLSTMKQIAQEGRKFFVGLGLISQRPSRVDADVLSQCNNQIIMRMTNPNDQNYVRRISEWVTDEDLEEIRALAPGEAYVFGPATIMSLPIIVRPRGTFHGGITPDLKDELQKF
ncbi:MAG: ATP-binding protein [Candidatus Bathyarchaeia archaeon]